MIPALISGGASVIGGLVNSIFGSRSNRKANETNMKIAQMNNEFNAAEAQKNRDFMSAEREQQNAWNLEQWNRENEYNSASSQRARLEEAGLNPYLMMSGGSAGTASSVSSGSSSAPGNATADPVRQMPYQPQFSFSGVADAINSYFDNRKKAAEAYGIGLNNSLTEQFGPDRQRAEIASAIDGQFEFLNPAYRNARFAEAPDLAGIDINKKRASLESMRIHQELEMAQGSLAYMNAESQRILNKYLPQQQQADLWIKSSQIFRNYADGMLSKEKLNSEIANQVKLAAETRGQRISNKIAASTASAIIQAMNQEHTYNRDYYRFLRKHARDAAEYDIRYNKASALTAEHNERVARAARQWRHVDKTTAQIGNMLGAFGSGVKSTAILKSLGKSRSSSNRELFPWID